VDVKGKGQMSCYLLNAKHHINPRVEKDQVEEMDNLVYADLSHDEDDILE